MIETKVPVSEYDSAQNEPVFGKPGDGVYWRRPTDDERAAGIRAVFVDERTEDERRAARAASSARSTAAYYGETNDHPMVMVRT